MGLFPPLRFTIIRTHVEQPAAPRARQASLARNRYRTGAGQLARARDARGIALPAWVEPQLATLTRDRFSDAEWLFERKLDGERCLVFADDDGVRLMSRNQRDITTTYPDVAAALAAQISAPGQILDGEIVAFRGSATSFSQLQQRLGLQHPSASVVSAVPVTYYLFDVMYSGGRDVRPLPQLERKQLLRRLLSFDDPLRYTEHRERDGEEYFAQACSDGWEGLIAKRAAAPYRSGRTRDWLKFKCENAQEFVIGGFTDPQGSRQGLGALLIGYYDPDGRLNYAGKVGTGFSENVLRQLHAELSRLQRDSAPFDVGRLPRARVHWVEPRLVAEVGFSEWTTDGQLRHPRYQGLRDDKEPAEVVRETPA
jgi:bifunctional non-homologous end joining protein LigD